MRALFSKVMPNFWWLELRQFKKYNNFLWRYWFLVKNLSDFVSLHWKLDNPYYHDRCPLCPPSSYAPEMKIGEGSRLTYFAQPSRIHVDLASFPVWAWYPKNFANQEKHESLACFLHETNIRLIDIGIFWTYNCDYHLTSYTNNYSKLDELFMT